MFQRFAFLLLQVVEAFADVFIRQKKIKDIPEFMNTL